MDTSRAAAAALDDADPLAGFRARFSGTEDDGADRLLYLDGNSLGRLPLETPAALPRVVEQRVGRGAGRLVVGWIEQADPDRRRARRRRPGRPPGRGAGRRLDLGQPLQAARRRGRRPARAATCSSARADDFPTDRYIVAGVARARGHDRARAAGRHRPGAGPGGRWPPRWTSGSPSSSCRTWPTGPARWRTSRAITAARARRRRAGAVGPLALRGLGAGRARPRPAPTSPSAARTSTSTAARARRRSSTCAATCRSSCAQPIQGWFGQRDQFAMGPAYEPADGHRAVRRRHAAGARPWPRSRSASGWSPRPGIDAAGREGAGADRPDRRAGRRVAGAARRRARLAAGRRPARLARHRSRTRRRGS